MAFWKPGTVAPGSSIDREADTSAPSSSADVAFTSRVLSSLSISERRARLPIAKQRQALLYALEQHPVLVLSSPTGTGKSTQLPQFLLEAGWCSTGLGIAVTQPRRVAAISVATRVAEEVGTPLGDEVGYAVRFEQRQSKETKILFCTDGMLFREVLADPLLSRYGVVMVDEAHERGVYTDLLLGVLKKIRKVRPELRIIISSATLDAAAFADFFNSPSRSTDAPPPKRAKLSTAAGEEAKPTAIVVALTARSYPVDIQYLPKAAEDYIVSACRCVLDIHSRLPAGDVLVFLSGREEIDRLLQLLADSALSLPGTKGEELQLLGLHAGLTAEQQMKVFEPAEKGKRKVVVSTNVAEASVTIDGIGYVVDSGVVKLKTYDSKTGMDSLARQACSLASLAQRAGRAGRTRAGTCFRLFPEAALSRLTATTPPEIARSDPAALVLQLKSLGIRSISKFDFVSPPLAATLDRAEEWLFALKALDEEGQLTRPLGQRMAEMPVDPQLARILLSSAEYGCSEEVLTVAAMCSVQPPWVGDGWREELERRKFVVEEGDHLTLLNVFTAFTTRGKSSAKWCSAHFLSVRALSRAVSVRNQLRRYLIRWGVPLISCKGDAGKVTRCLIAGYFRNAAQVQPDGTYRSVRGNAVLHVHPSSVLFTRTPKTGFVIYHEVIETTKRFMRDLTVIEKEWLVEEAGHYYSFKRAGK